MLCTYKILYIFFTLDIMDIVRQVLVASVSVGVWLPLTGYRGIWVGVGGRTARNPPSTAKLTRALFDNIIPYNKELTWE